MKKNNKEDSLFQHISENSVKNINEPYITCKIILN